MFCLSLFNFRKAGEIIRPLVGVVTPVPAQWITSGRDTSIMYSQISDGTQLMLGPLRFVNHDCNPNAEVCFNGLIE